MTSRTKAVLVGIDTLVVNAHFPLNERLSEELKQAKQETYNVRLSALVEQLYQWQEQAQLASKRRAAWKFSIFQKKNIGRKSSQGDSLK